MIYVTITGGHARDNFSNQITDADEACRSSELSVNLIGRVVRPKALDKFSDILFIYLDMRDFNVNV
jgi:hypothetical protein